MKLSFLRRLAVQVLVVTVALVAMLTSGAPAQSLGDVARQEESRRKGTGTGAGKVYTNGDLRGAPAPATTSPSPSPTPSASSPSSAAPAAPADATKPGTKPADGNAKAGDAQTAKPGATPATDPKGDAASWRKRREDIQTSIDRATTFSEALQSRINGLSADFAARDDPAQRSRVAADRQKALTELDRVKKEIADHTKALADLQEEARRSGIPAGWLR